MTYSDLIRKRSDLHNRLMRLQDHPQAEAVIQQLAIVERDIALHCLSDIKANALKMRNTERRNELLKYCENKKRELQ